MKCISIAADDVRIEPFLRAHAAAINQSPAWANVQKSLGVGSLRFGIENEARDLVGYAQIFVRRLPFGLTWWSVPRGPVLQGRGEEARALLVMEIGKWARNEGAVYVRFDWPEEEKCKIQNAKFKIREAGETNFPSTTLMLDLSKSDEELLAEMHPKGRYNIRVAEKRGVTVREVMDDSAAEIFFDLLEKTTARDGFAGHGRAYYVDLLKTLVSASLATTFVAEVDGQPAAAIIVTFAGRTATYYYGASDHAYRAAMAPYAVQWAAARAARVRGCTRYDFLGIAPEGAVHHSLAGVTDFKRKFGGAVVTYAPSVDLILRPIMYRALTFVRRLRHG